MPKYAVTIMLVTPQQIMVETDEGKLPVELTPTTCTVRGNAKSPMLAVPANAFVRYDLINEEALAKMQGRTAGGLVLPS